MPRTLNRALPHSTDSATPLVLRVNAQDAAQDYQRAIEVATAQNVPAGKADALNGLALLSESQNQGQQALNYANQALAIRQSLGDRSGQAAILAEIATGYNSVGDTQQALDFGNRALDLYRAAGDHTGEATTLIGIGDIYAGLRDKKCIDAWTQALAAARQFHFPLVEAEALNRLGLAQNALQQNQRALDSFNQALAIYQRLNMTDEAGLMLNNIGLAWSGLGEMEKAIDSFSQALPILRASGDEDGQGIALQNIGLMHQFLGDRQTAIQYFKQAFPHLITARDFVDGLTLLDNLGSTLAATGDYKNALLFLNKVISIQKGMPNREHEALARIIIGMVYHKMGDNPKAIDSVNQGLELISHLNDPANESRARIGLAKIYWDMGDVPHALANLNQALPLAEAANDPLILSPILYGMMLAHKSQPALAIFYGKQSVNLLQQVRSNMRGLDKETQSAFVTSNSDYYRDLADLLIAQGRLPEAQQVLDLLKQQEYSEYVRGAGTDSLSPLSLTPSELKAQQDYDKSTAQLVAAGEQWAELKNLTTRTPAQEQQLKELSDRVNAANQALDDYYGRLYTLFGKDSTAANDRLKNVKGNVSALQDQIAESPHTVALYTMVTANHYSVIVITPNATVAHDYTIAAADLNKKVADFQQVLHNPASDPKPLAQDLYNILIGPVQADLDNAKAETLVWSLDGVLRYIPIAALYDGKQYVVQKYNTVTITPASIDHLEDKPDVSKLSVAAMGIARKYEAESSPAARRRHRARRRRQRRAGAGRERRPARNHPPRWSVHREGDGRPAQLKARRGAHRQSLRLQSRRRQPELSPPLRQRRTRRRIPPDRRGVSRQPESLPPPHRPAHPLSVRNRHERQRQRWPRSRWPRHNRAAQRREGCHLLALARQRRQHRPAHERLLQTLGRRRRQGHQGRGAAQGPARPASRPDQTPGRAQPDAASSSRTKRPTLPPATRTPFTGRPLSSWATGDKIRRTVMKRAPLYCGLFLLAFVAAGAALLRVHPLPSHPDSKPGSFKAGGLRSFEIVPLETVSETSANASIGDLNGDGHPDIVLVKGRHWRVPSRIFFGDGKGHFTPGPALPSAATKSYSGSLADMTKSGHLDMVLSNDEPDPKLVLLNDGKGNFTIGGTYGDPKWSTRNAAVGDLNGDGYPDIAVANREMTSYVCINDGLLHFNCRPLKDSPSAATVAIADIDGDGANDVIYACRDSCQSVVYFNDGKGNFDRTAPWGPPHSSTRAMAVADFNGDGHLDIAACHEDLGCFVYLNDGKGHFGPGIRFDSPKAVPYSMIAADLNRDGRPEIVVGFVEAPGVIYFNDGTGKKISTCALRRRQGCDLRYGRRRSRRRWLAGRRRRALRRTMFRHVQPPIQESTVTAFIYTTYSARSACIGSTRIARRAGM